MPRQIHADRLQLRCRRQALDPFDRMFEHPLIEARRKIETFRRGQKCRGRNQAAIFILHANQELSMPSGELALNGPNILSEQHELIIIQRAFDTRSPPHLAGSGRDGLVGIDPHMDAVAPGLLGRITGIVSGLQDGGERWH